jgi:hypothetical protein
MKFANDILRGSLQVTKARDPAKFWAIKCVPFNNLF